ncbi:MAG: calcium-translocating P-type ATPase, PMCA-type [Alphaproteobacteria bacterium]|nr:calcium-translocating P-type ATPase, PMCA-type [Alphaproteobacteria bacterium]
MSYPSNNLYCKDIQTSLDTYGVKENEGLSDKQIEENLSKFGSNSLSKPPKESLLKKLFSSLMEPMVLMLEIAALIAFGINYARGLNGQPTEYIECVGIVVAIFLSVSISLIMEGRSAKAFDALNKIKDDIFVKVSRNNEIKLINQKDLVVGDIVFIETGAKVPADGRLIFSQDLQIEEASLTGESVSVNKSHDYICPSEDTPLAERKNMVYSGTFVTGGSGRIVVTAVGDNTEIGIIAKELSATDTSLTPLQEKLEKLGKNIAIWGILAAILAFGIQLITFIHEGTADLNSVSEAFITSIVLIVAAVPEGLPTTVAICLAINIIKMSREKALVKKMVACETIGCVNVICSDKTGTLTENKMTVVEVCQNGEITTPDKITDEEFIQNFCINSTADVDEDDSFIGNPTECALLVASKKSGYKYKDIRNSVELVHTYPFCSDTKNMTTVVKKDGKLLAFTKGSPEKILAMCAISNEDQQKYAEMICRFQQKAYRVIGFAHKELEQTPSDFIKQRAEIESRMVFDGFTAIADPLRKEVFAAIQNCRSAGIDIKMLTGDNIITAKAIATELNMLDENHIALEANDINQMDDNELAKTLPKIRVIARSTPVVKMRVVKMLKKLGSVVAVTGDGINDAPALKNADIGLAMGISGTEVSKEASDVVLLDDSFSTIVKAIKWGRGIYENFQRFILFQLTVNLSSVVVVLASVIIGFPSPFTALQLLWVNLIMDGPPALTLSLEPIRASLMNNKPTPRNANIVTRNMLKRIIYGGLLISVLFMLQHQLNILQIPEKEVGTALFTLFVLFQLVNAFNCRELTNQSIVKHFFDNKLMLLAFAVTFAVQVAITQFGGEVFKTSGLCLESWGKVIGLSLVVMFAMELFKLISRIFKKN